MKCRLCNPFSPLDIPMTKRAAADWEAGIITHREAEKRSLISHARHVHTSYEKAVRKCSTELEVAKTRDHYNAIARRKLGLGRGRHSWVALVSGEAWKQRRLAQDGQ